MAAMVSASAGALSFLEEGTGFLVAFTMEEMEQLRVRAGGQLPGEGVQPGKEGAQIGFGAGGGHLGDRVFQLFKRVEYLLFCCCHSKISRREK